MARTEGEICLDAPLVEMCEADAAAGFALSEEAGWNQTAEDWSMMIRLGRAFAFARTDERLIATGLALPYPPDFGWISMVLVHGPYQRRGLGTRILERTIAELRERGLVPLLDATPAGRGLYESMGFRAIEGLTRWRGEGGGRAGDALAPVLPGEVGEIGELDTAAFGADRSAVLADLLSRPGAVSRRDPDGRGFLISRAGRTATQIGPVIARTAEVAIELLEAGLAAITGPVLIDVPDRESELARLLQSRGFRPERPFIRMGLGRGAGFGDPSAVRAVAGPELG